MPLKVNSSSTVRSNPQIVFVSLVLLSLILWIFYRLIFDFPIIFDETIGKAIFFGLPILIYVNVNRDKNVVKTISLNKIFPGLLRGLAFGGLFGFFAIIVALIRSGRNLVAAPLFVVDQFWWESLLALLTAFWESLFFFGFMQTILGTVFKKIKPTEQVFIISILFLLFHLPNIALRFTGDASFLILLIYLFGLGQAIIFSKEKNVYTLIMTQAIWGLALMIHF